MGLRPRLRESPFVVQFSCAFNEVRDESDGRRLLKVPSFGTGNLCTLTNWRAGA